MSARGDGERGKRPAFNSPSADADVDGSDESSKSLGVGAWLTPCAAVVAARRRIPCYLPQCDSYCLGSLHNRDWPLPDRLECPLAAGKQKKGRWCLWPGSGYIAGSSSSFVGGDKHRDGMQQRLQEGKLELSDSARLVERDVAADKYTASARGTSSP